VLDDPDHIVGAGADTSMQLGAFCEVIVAIANIGTAARTGHAGRSRKALVAIHAAAFRLGPGFSVGVGNGLLRG
jgi:hypothetical protein